VSKGGRVKVGSEGAGLLDTSPSLHLLLQFQRLLVARLFPKPNTSLPAIGAASHSLQAIMIINKVFLEEDFFLHLLYYLLFTFL